MQTTKLANLDINQILNRKYSSFESQAPNKSEGTHQMALIMFRQSGERSAGNEINIHSYWDQPCSIAVSQAAAWSLATARLAFNGSKTL